jgi:hypothetical protein
MKKYKVFLVDGRECIIEADKVSRTYGSFKFFVKDELVAEFGVVCVAGWVELRPQ